VTVFVDDERIRTGLTARDAVQWLGEAIDAHHRGDLVAPPRTQVELGGGRLVFATGRLRGSWFGYRSYDTIAAGPGSQLVVVQDEASGEVRAVAVGNELGPRRVGAIGGVAADALAPPRASTAAVIGTGVQAAAQLWALSSVRALRQVQVFSRDPASRQAFAERMTTTTGVACRAAATARDAVTGAEIVILATSSPTPVIDAAWLRPGAYVATLGPKQQGRAEFGLDLVEMADLVVTDSPAQLAAYEPPSVLVGTPQQRRLASLGAVRAGEHALPQPGRTRLFCSVGLAGTEAFLLERLAARLRGEPRPGPARAAASHQEGSR
jgi:ornithine cyclodeaminase/alanine dehydrogenase-like protein (mu-crystallin family)